MPAGHPPIIAHPSKPFRTLRDAARDGQIINIRCNYCRRGATFLASDLIQVVDPKHPVHLPPFGCSKCGKMDCVDVRAQTVSAIDIGRMRIRKLVGQKTVSIWRNQVLGDKRNF